MPPPRPRAAVPDVPLPPVRPADLSPAPENPAPAPPLAAPAPAATAPADALIPRDDAACQRLFASGKVDARALPAIAGPGGCGIAAPIEMSAVVVSPTQRIAIRPAATVDCALAAAVADWVRDDLVPGFAAAASPLAGLAETSGYACRPRNSIAGAKLSEHGHGNALDIGAFATTGGGRVAVRETRAPVLVMVRATACARFATVLGPGSDGFHESHMHVDLAARAHGGTICQWQQDDASVPARGPR